jgi:anti-sigma B factor antagonist
VRAVDYLRVSVDVQPDRVVVTLDGEIDVSSAPELRDTLVTVISEFHPALLVVDCTQVTYLDAIGVGVLVGAAGRLAATGDRLVLRNVQDLVRKVLDLTSAVDQLTIE